MNNLVKLARPTPTLCPLFMITEFLQSRKVMQKDHRDAAINRLNAQNVKCSQRTQLRHLVFSFKKDQQLLPLLRTYCVLGPVWCFRTCPALLPMGDGAWQPRSAPGGTEQGSEGPLNPQAALKPPPHDAIVHAGRRFLYLSPVCKNYIFLQISTINATMVHRGKATEVQVGPP